VPYSNYLPEVKIGITLLLCLLHKYIFLCCITVVFEYFIAFSGYLILIINMWNIMGGAHVDQSCCSAILRCKYFKPEYINSDKQAKLCSMVTLILFKIIKSFGEWLSRKIFWNFSGTINPIDMIEFSTWLWSWTNVEKFLIPQLVLRLYWLNTPDIPCNTNS
jgi:hypothetical protein